MRILTLLSLFLFLAAGADAQYYPGDYFSVTWAGWFVKTTQTGVVTSLQINTSSHYQTEVDLDNTLALVPDSGAGAVWEVDPVVMAVVGTLTTHPDLKSTVYGMHFDHNGDLFIAPSKKLVKVDPTGVAVAVTGPGASLAQHMTVDIDTGDLIVGTGSSAYRISRDGQTSTMLGSGFNYRYGDLDQDILTGDLYAHTCCGWIGQSLHVLRAGTTTVTTALVHNGLAGAYGPNVDRASAANPRIVTGSHIYTSSYPTSGGMWYIDLKTYTPTKLAPFPHKTISDTCILGSRNLQTVRTGQGKYDIRLSIPTEGSKSYVLGISMTGVRPAYPLADGRRIPLIVDHLTPASVNGWMAPYVTGTVGTLDPFGKATGKMDVSSLYQHVRGLRLWLLLVTLDAKAPLGISTICDPKILVIE